MSTRIWLPIGLTAAILGVVPTVAVAAPLVSGQLTDDRGRPVSGPVTVHAWPRSEGAPMVLAATATANDAGEFTAHIADEAALRRVAADDEGWVDFLAVGGSGSTTGQWVFTSRITDADATLRSMRVYDAISRGGARAAANLRPPRIRLRIPRRGAMGSPVAGPASMTGRCNNRDPERRRPQSVARWAIVGELNNAYADTRAQFKYGQQHHAETSFGVAVSKDNEATFVINGETHVANSGSITFPVVQRRYARKLRTKFEFTREQIRVTPCSAWETYIRVTDWLGGTNDSLKQPGALNTCDPYIGEGQPGAVVVKNSAHAVRWTRGVSAFGVYLTAKSGFSTNVGLEYRFGHTKSKYYICGPNGKQGFKDAGRVFSGAR